jgi:hypothetical protein
MIMGSLFTSFAERSYVRGASAMTDTSDFLDPESLRRQELSILSSLRDESVHHRSLQTLNNCMEDLGGSLSCTALDVKFLNVTGVEVYDPGAYQDPVTGIWKDACRGIDYYVNLAFTADMELGADRYDIGMYINIEGGSAFTGSCALALLSQTDFQLGTVPPEVISFANGNVTIGELETGNDPPDECPDYTNTVNGGATLTDYPFAPVSFWA